MVTPAQLARELEISAKTVRAWLRARWPREASGLRWELTDEQVALARQRWSAGTLAQVHRQPHLPARAWRARDSSDEAYVLGLLDQLLGTPGLRQHTFPWLVGDTGPRGRRRLPVDGYWPQRKLVVEYRERQHHQPVPHFDKRLTVSGVHRGEQRRRYDQRRDQLIPEHGLSLLVIQPEQLTCNKRGRLRRDHQADLAALRALLTSRGQL
jgi:hypothetical protein